MISHMPDLLIRNVPPQTLAAVKARAKRHGRSLQAEALDALNQAAGPAGRRLVAWLKSIRDGNIDVKAAIKTLREDRDR
jgi:plasmid stability protein